MRGRPAGGGVWQTGSYDPETNLYIVGTGNPAPGYDAEFRPGDNLYTDSVVALDVATGELAWYFQYTPNDSWDYDEAGVHLLYDIEIDGRLRNVVSHFGRNGFFYTLESHRWRLHPGCAVCQRPELDCRSRPGDRKAGRVRPDPRRADLPTRRLARCVRIGTR